MNDIVLNKKESIERCVKQVRTYYGLPGDLPFEEDYLKQDAIALNLQRACEQCIDLANHTIRVRKLGLPNESKESFRLLEENHIIPKDLAGRLQGMIGLRYVLVHEYQRLDIRLMIDVIENRLDDLLLFVDCIVKEFCGGPRE
ncbi:MAG: hypothetical protein H6Q57_84 [Geobacteraceae bacterium]|nr:hypothetical protein [Geobacteraceae bacterium]